MKDKHPILANGQYYIDPLVKKTYGGEIEYPHEYEDAKIKLTQDITNIQSAIMDSDEVFADQKVVCIRLRSNTILRMHTMRCLRWMRKERFLMRLLWHCPVRFRFLWMPMGNRRTFMPMVWLITLSITTWAMMAIWSWR